MAGLALARRDPGRSPAYVFDVDRSLFYHCRVSDAGCKPVGEFGSDVSFFASFGYMRFAMRVINAKLEW